MLKLDRQKLISKKIIITAASLAVVALTCIGVYLYTHQPVKITTNDISDIAHSGNITSSTSQEQAVESLQAPANETVVFESQPVKVVAKANAAVLEWDQDGHEGVEIEVRTHNGREWTPWSETSHDDGGKDGTEEVKKASALVIANTIREIQFRYTLSGSASQSSATVNAASSSLQTIDSSQGPTGEPSIFDKIGAFFNLNDTASAKADGPRIITREEWGCPEPNSSAWTPEYERLAQAIVHHTATTEAPNAASAIRAIWQYHTYNRGWGDIGYNYLVDSAGNIFQGRYYDKTYAEDNTVDVVAGHAYDHNRGTTGISAIGDFSKGSPTGAQKEAISKIIGFKLAPYDINPSGNGGYGAAVVGHRDVYPTACPGTNLYPQINSMRTVASGYYLKYNAEHKIDYQLHSQRLYKNGDPITADTVLKPQDSIELAVALRNAGSEPWHNNTTYKTVLGTANPTDRRSSFYDPDSWISANRAGSFTHKLNTSNNTETVATTIQPNEVAVFRFSLKIPDVLSSGELSSQVFKEYFRPVQDGRAWFPRDIGMYYPVKVEKHRYDWQYVSQNLYTSSAMTTPAPSTLTPNTRYYARLTLKNTGNATWQQQTFRLGTSNPKNRTSGIYDSTWLSQNRTKALDQTSVAPNQNGTFSFWIKTPAHPTTQKEYFLPVVDGTTWLRDIGLYWNIKSQ